MADRFRRFSSARIAEHWLQTAIFTVLVITGLSQKYYPYSLSQWIMLHLGGIDSVRLIHRYAGLLFGLAVLAHIGAGAFGILCRHWQSSMVITRNDIGDAVHSIKYYLGNEQYPAMHGKYSYMQKFEYWGILTGALLMIATGAVLWRPLLVTRFITGEIIPAAKVLHSNEALVVLLIIALWHMYNAIFSPEVFPLNTSMFTGYLSRDRMVQEHILELARIENTTPAEIRARRAREETVPGEDDPG